MELRLDEVHDVVEKHAKGRHTVAANAQQSAATWAERMARLMDTMALARRRPAEAPGAARPSGIPGRGILQDV